MQTLGQDQLCNLALYNIGSNQIVDISDNTPEAQACNIFWIPCLQDVYSEHQWAFANAQVVLDLLTNVYAGWAYAYQYPNNVARVWDVYNPCNYKKREELEFDTIYDPNISGRVIVSNEPQAICDATYIVPDPLIWDAKFAIAFSERLSAQIAVPLTGDAAVAQAHLMVYTALIAEAKRIGHSEQRKKPNPVHGYRDARSGHGERSGTVSLDQVFGPDGPPTN
jgi:hypothetical protein